jgi:hypothetical protein
VARHDRFGDAKLVDPPLDRLQRLTHRVIAKLLRDVRLERVGIGAASARRTIELGRDVRFRRSKRLLVGDALDLDLGGAHGGDRALNGGGAHRRAQPFGGQLRRQPQRIVGVNAEHEVDTAL